jgi:hypothetical protein
LQRQLLARQVQRGQLRLSASSAASCASRLWREASPITTSEPAKASSPSNTGRAIDAISGTRSARVIT